MDSPYLRRLDKRSKGSHGVKAEKKFAKRIGGKQQVASGALDGAKGDVTLSTDTHDFLIENKATANDSYKLKLDTLLKVYQEALEIGKTPALAVQFTTLDGVSSTRGRWVMIPEHVFKEIIGGQK